MGNTGACLPTVESESVSDRDSIRSAVMLIDNYVVSYGCALSEASNGRQYFQLPSYLAALVGVAGGAFGGGRDLAVASGIAASTANSANGYWDPQTKAGILDHSLDAILCIKNEAVGNAFVDTTLDPNKMWAFQNVVGPKITLPVEWRYFALVSTALAQVDRITGDRLRGVGKYDPAGLIAEIEALNEKIEEAEADPSPETATDTPADGTQVDENEDSPADDELEDAADRVEDDAGPADDDSEQTTAPGQTGEAAARTKELKAWFARLQEQSQGTFELDLDVIAPKLSRCVLRAKL